MRKLLAIFLAAGLVGFTVFGFFIMGHMGHAGESGPAVHGGCWAENLQKTACPMKAGLLDFVGFHVQAVKIFSLAAPATALTSWLALAGLLLIGIFFVFSRSPGERGLLLPAGIFSRSLPAPPFSARDGFRRWLALHERRDSARALN